VTQTVSACLPRQFSPSLQPLNSQLLKILKEIAGKLNVFQVEDAFSDLSQHRELHSFSRGLFQTEDFICFFASVFGFHFHFVSKLIPYASISPT